MRPCILVLIALLLYVPPAARADQPTPQGVEVPSATKVAIPVIAEDSAEPSQASLAQTIELSDVAADPSTPEARARLHELTVQMHAELAALHERVRANVVEIDGALAKGAALDAEALLELDRRTASIKQAERIESLRIQARYAREVGAEMLAAEIDASVEKMLSPVIEATGVDPMPRPRHHAQQR